MRPVEQGWLKCVLEKKNMETMHALDYIARHCQLDISALSTAGIKDKRALTTQFLTVCASVNARRLLAINSEDVPLRVGNLSPTDAPLQNGQLKCNRFKLVLRDVDATEAVIRTAVAAIQQNGFVNYYGAQRFGDEKYEVQSYTIGAALLQGQWQKAVSILLTPEPDGDEAVRTAKQHYQETQDVEKTLSLMPSNRRNEVAVLKTLKRHANSPDMWEKALLAVPFTLRSLWIHAYCSRVWNRAATHRLRCLGPEVVAGDLVLAGDSKTATPVTKQAAADGTFNITDVVMPMPGKHIVYPSNSSGDVYDTLLSEDCLVKASFSKALGVSLSGAYRPLVVRPTLTMQREGEGAWVAEFELPPAVYATMLMRELTKQ
eukprot:NODE_957_length_1744_cov_26.476809_g897_i0.p1 GENE.NODE_957_length_1744_cov_26.476809_g897_i0~~NODE_957_length_1744_cov_26.476809_g897_i0.p1  ORF type:complete len:374 (-),score=86.86 NODE_957_length_1744_cov_26.476809_g897_i0:17-1138(-)